jgi:arylsulfatase A-like enzyme
MKSPDSLGTRVATPRWVVGAVAVLCVAGLLGVKWKVLLRWIGGDRTSDANVILISIDTLRADRLSLYGYHRPTSPHLEELASRGIVFDRFYQNGGGTLESHLTMMTSLRPGSHQVTSDTKRSLEAERITLAETLKAAGYVTAGFVDDGWMAGTFGFNQGFDVYDDRGGGFREILPRVRGWIDARDGRPFFLFVHTYDVHSAFHQLPYDCPADYPNRYTAGARPAFTGCRDGRCASTLLDWLNRQIAAGALEAAEFFSPGEVDYISALYDGCINYADDEVAGLLDLLRRRDLFDNSLIIVTSDHGEEFLDHGMVIHAQSGYEEFARVPLVVKMPGEERSGVRVDHLAAMIDVMPTILDRLGIQVPAQAQGFSLLPLIRTGRPIHDDVHLEDGIVTARWKYIGDRGLLFDLKNDPRERLNLAPAFPNLVKLFSARLRATTEADRREYSAFARRVSPAEPLRLSKEKEERLRSLGYVGR